MKKFASPFFVAFLFVGAFSSQDAPAQIINSHSSNDAKQRGEKPPPVNDTLRSDPRMGKPDSPRPFYPSRSNGYFANLAIKAGERHLNNVPPDYFKAAEMFKKATELDPRSTRAFLRLGFASNHTGLYGDAVIAYATALQLDKKSVEAMAGLGTANFKREKFDWATTFFQNAIALKPKHLVANVMLANCYFMQKDYAQAINGYQKALSIEPKSIDARYNLILTYLESGSQDEAVKQIQILEKYSKEKSLAAKEILNNRDSSGKIELLIP